MKKTLLLFGVAIASLAGYAQQKTVDVATAGELSSLIAASEKYAITELTVTGTVNGADLAFIRDMAGKDEEGATTEGQLQQLDLGGAAIVSGGVYYTDMQSAAELTAEANTVGQYMFRDLNLTKIVLPQGITTLGYRAFYNCKSLETIEGAEVATSLDKAVFESCTSLTSVAVNASLTEVPEALFKRCNALDAFTFPVGVTTIGKEAFYGCKLSTLTLPEGLVTIGEDAFNSIEATAVTLPTTVKELAEGAFYSCYKLAELNLNDGLEKLGERALAYNRAATKYVIPSTVSSIGESCFANCSKLEEVVLPEGITTIPAYCFDRSMQLTTVNIPSTVTFIDENAFQTCGSLTDVTLPEGLVELGERAFVDCESITELTLPSTLTTIGNEALSGTGISEIVIPEGITRLGGEGGMWNPSGSVFSWCMNLAKVELPSTIEALGCWTFSACPLEQITIHAVTPPNIVGFTNNPFDDDHFETCTVIVPAGSLDSYKNDEDGWGQFQNIKDETTTGLTATTAARQQESTTVYTLDGRRATSAAKGIVIAGQRKVMKK